MNCTSAFHFIDRQLGYAAWRRRRRWEQVRNKKGREAVMRLSKPNMPRLCFSSQVQEWFVKAMIDHRWARVTAHLLVMVRFRRNLKHHLHCIIREYHDPCRNP